MRKFILMLSGAMMAAAQSHPGWWTFADPESKSLIGVKWSAVRDSPAAAALRASLAPGGGLLIPGLACLMNSRDFLIATPPLMIGANGGCSVAEVKAQAGALGMKHAVYKGIDLWIAAEKSGLSLAQWNERVELMGTRRDLQDAIDRSQAENRQYCPLLIAAARQSRLQDVWVVDGEDPDPLAEEFAPIVERVEQEKAAASSPVTAIPIHPAPPIPVPVVLAKPEAPPRAEPVKPEIAARVETAEKPQAAKAELEKAADVKSGETKPEKRVIRIYGLDGGTREIVLPPKDPL